MSTENFDDRLLFSQVVSLVEDALFEADDDAVLAAPGSLEVANDTRDIVQAAVRAARVAGVQSFAPTLRSRRGERRRLPRMAVQKLLVASPRARDIVGKASVDGMTDAEFEAAIERLAASGELPKES